MDFDIRELPNPEGADLASSIKSFIFIRIYGAPFVMEATQKTFLYHKMTPKSKVSLFLEGVVLHRPRDSSPFETVDRAFSVQRDEGWRWTLWIFTIFLLLLPGYCDLSGGNFQDRKVP